MSILKNALVIYEENLLDKADDYFVALNGLDGWKYNKVKGYELNRETIVFADPEIKNDNKFIPKIWGKDVKIYDWTNELLEIKQIVEKKVKEITGKEWIYNIALGNRYKKSKDYINFHSDNEEFGNTQSIASVSLGIPRTFTYMSKDIENKEKVSLILQNGSLIFMGERCQENYCHGMKKESLNKFGEDIIKKYDNTRINITFRVWNYEKNDLLIE